jgi:hypothetical protein
MYQLSVVVEGVGRGLLMHKFSMEASAEIEKEVKRSKSTKLPPSDQAEQVAYRIEAEDDKGKGQLCLPAEHFLGAIVATGSSFQKKGQGKLTYKGAFQGSVDVLPDYLGLMDSSGKPLFDFAVDSRPVRIKATQGRIIRHRPFFKDWRTKFIIQVNDDGIPIEVIQAALEESGRSKCVGDYRPRFGQFRIVSCEKCEA